VRVRDEEWPVHCVTEAQLPGGPQADARPAQLRDIAILMPTRASLPQLEAALERVEIPYRVESAPLGWGTQGVRDLLATVHFIAWADRQADEHTRVKESALPEADDDAVRILTVHGAKGLQFPVVIVTGLNRPKNGAVNRPATVLWDGDRPEVSTWSRSLWKGFKTSGFAALN